MNLLASSITITKNPRIIAATVSKKTTHAQLDDIARLFNTIGGIGGFDHVLHGARHAKERDGDCNRRHHNIAAAMATNAATSGKNASVAKYAAPAACTPMFLSLIASLV